MLARSSEEDSGWVLVQQAQQQQQQPQVQVQQQRLQQQAAAGGEFLRRDAEEHFRDEYSAYDWVMDGLLSRSGFTIRSKLMDSGVIGTYICAKN